MPSPVFEIRIPFKVGNEVFETYCKVVGDLSTCLPHGPAIVLHGGPGMSHDSMIPVGDLADQLTPIPVILYDQIGSGRSTHLQHKDLSFWTIDLFIDELENILSHFKISASYNLIAHSWGATMASEFIVRRQPKGLRRLVMQGALASSKLRNEAGAKLRQELPQDVVNTLKMHEKAGTTTSEGYWAAMMVFWERHACRLKPFPPEAAHSMRLPPEDGTVLKAMRNGPVGLADHWDITDRIHLMRHVPTLFINGEYDCMTDDVCAPFFWGIDRVKCVKFANSSHMPHWEERERYVSTVHAFLTQGAD